MLKGIHHVAIICSDYEKSKYFYTSILGLDILAENFREERNSYKLDLKLPNGSQLELFSFPEPPSRASYPEACGLRHLAFIVEDIEKVSDYLKSVDIEVQAIQIDEYTGKKYLFFNDPDNLPIELYEQS